MMRHGQVSEVVTDMSIPPSALPPLNNLPQWSRINTLDKARYPKPFLKDRLQPLPNAEGSGGAGERRQGSADTESDHELEVNEAKSDPTVRIQHLEKSLSFLRNQHQEILSNLHDEIDKLKRDNKELQFRMVMVAKNPGSPVPRTSGSDRRKVEGKTPASSSTSAAKENRELSAMSKQGAVKQEEHADPQSEQHSQVSDEELKIIFLEEEIKELKKTLREETTKNQQFKQLLERAELQYNQMLQQQQQAASTHQQSTPGGAPLWGPRSLTQPASTLLYTERELQQEERTVKPVSAGPHQHHGARGPGSAHREARALSAVSPGEPGPAPSQMPFGATLGPLMVHRPTSQGPRQPSVPECEAIINHLQQANDKQAHELNRLKSDLRDVLYSHKWTPDAYLLAKAYIAEDDARETAEQGKLPRIPMKPSTRKLPDIAYIQKDAVSLPALKQTMGNKAIERRKRTQILQKARLRREITGGNEASETY